MATLHSSDFTPSADDITNQLTWTYQMINNLDPRSPTYETEKAYYESLIDNLLQRVPTDNVADPMDFGNLHNGAGGAALPASPAMGDRSGSSASSYTSPYSAYSSPADSYQGPSRKRSLGSLGSHESPESKRPSHNSSPAVTPGTPNFPQSSYSATFGQAPVQRQVQIPIHNHHSNNGRLGGNLAPGVAPGFQNNGVPFDIMNAVEYSVEPDSASATLDLQRYPNLTFAPMDPNGIIDLTGDDPDADTFHPVGNSSTNPFINYFPPADQSGRDPFPELHNAFQPNSRPQPADAFNQDTMNPEELAEFMIRPPPAGGYAFDHHPPAVPMLPNALGQLNGNGVPAYRNLEQELFGGDSDDFDALPGTSPETIANIIENITPDEEVPPNQREKTPSAMCSQLMEHQKLGLTWLKKMEEGSNKGGILADEMGLGKTVQALALIVARPSSDRTCRTTLIIAPVALMRQWEKEIQRHINDSHRLKVHVYHGSGKNADFNKLRQFDVVLTTFGTLGSEFKQKEKRREAEFVQREQRDPAFRRKVKDKLALIGPECMWYRIIIDEAQCIKNKNTQVSKASAELQARHRLVMTGTPMMNSIDELYPLIRFLQIKPYNDQMRFSLHFSKMIKEERSREKGMQRVQALLKSIMLRRQKTSTIDGEQICKIPPKHTHQDAVEFTDDESELYKAIEGKTQLRFNKYLKAGTVTKNYAYILVLLLRLRQACCHPHLIKDLGVQVSTEGIDEVDLLERAKLLEPDAVGRIKAADAFECGICMDAVVNPTLFIPCGHDCCGECFQKLVDPTKAIREGNENNGPSCHICRGPLSSQKITDYRHFCKVFAPEKGTQVFGEEVNEDEGAGSESESESESADSDDDDDDDLDGFVVPDDVEDDFEPPVPQKSSSEKSKKSKQSSKAKGKAPAKTKTTLAQLKQESLKNKAAKRKYLRRLRKDWITSSKIEKTLQLVSEIGANDPTEKILIFSQFTSLLDLLEVPLHERGVKYQRYDGSMKMDDRAEAVNRFMDEADQQLMLISLKAGNAGLNLNKASQVIILDPFWNPFIEDQAVDRAHRMPQQREVHVHRVLVPQTVEDRICELQDKKRDLINSALDENAGKSISRLGVSELMYLFGMRERPDDRAN